MMCEDEKISAVLSMIAGISESVNIYKTLTFVPSHSRGGDVMQGRVVLEKTIR